MLQPHELLRIEYKKFNSTRCPVLDNEIVYFYRSGYEYLIRKGRKFRLRRDLSRRLRLLGYVISIISDKDFLVITKKIDNVTFYELQKSFAGGYVSVIICQIQGSPKHFLVFLTE